MKHLLISLIVTTTMLASCVNRPEESAVANSNENAVIEAIMARRSIRAYKEMPVEREKMDLIAKCGINAPNGMNAQLWEVRIVDNPEFINGATAAYVEQMKQTPRGAKMVEAPSFKNMFRNAPTIAVIAVKEGAFTKIDCGLMVQNMLLAAQSMGIGSICLGGPVGFFYTEAGAPYLERLNFSPEYKIALIVGFGYPDESPEARPRDESKVLWVE